MGQTKESKLGLTSDSEHGLERNGERWPKMTTTAPIQG